MKKTPFVSVIMNCYNGQNYLKEAIDSVYLQTYKNWEIIFWDNASTDNSSKIAKMYDDKLRYFKSNNTTVLGEARVKAVKEAKGEYLAFLDVDDLWLENKLEKQINLFTKAEEKIGIVYCRTKVVYENSLNKDFVIRENSMLPEGDIFSELAKEDFIVFSSAMVSRELFYLHGGFPKNFLNSTDYWIFLHLSEKYQCLAVQEVCCKYRIHQSNLSGKQRVIAAQESIDVLKSMQPSRSIDIGLKYQYASLIIENLKEKKYLDAISILIKNRVWSTLTVRIKNKFIKL
jgi:glycosyltransferase involved in cell wall biosynthesis